MELQVAEAKAGSGAEASFEDLSAPAPAPGTASSLTPGAETPRPRLATAQDGAQPAILATPGALVVTPPPAKYEIENPMAKIYRKQFESRRRMAGGELALPPLTEQDRMLKLGFAASAESTKHGGHHTRPASVNARARAHTPTGPEAANNVVEAADNQQSFYRQWLFGGASDENVLQMPAAIHFHIVKTRFSHWADLFGVSGVTFMAVLVASFGHSLFMFLLHVPDLLLPGKYLQWFKVGTFSTVVVCTFSLLEVLLISYRIANATCFWRWRLKTKVAKLCHVGVDNKGKPKASPLFKKVDIDLRVPTITGSSRKIGTVRCCRCRLHKWIRQLYVRFYDKVTMRFTDQDAHFFGFYKLISSFLSLFFYIQNLNILGSQGFDAAMMILTGLVIAIHMLRNILLTFQNNKYRVRLVYQLDFFCRRE